MSFLWECYIWDDWVGFRQKPTKSVGGSRQKPVRPTNCALRILLVVNKIKTVGPAKLCSHLENRCGKQRKTVGVCETVLSLGNINKVLF